MYTSIIRSKFKLRQINENNNQLEFDGWDMALGIFLSRVTSF